MSEGLLETVEVEPKTDTPRFLITIYVGIGDAISLGLSAVDQIVANEPEAAGKIDVLCNTLQAELFAYDPRINRVIEASRTLFPPPEVTMWLKGIFPNAEAARIIHFLRHRHYKAAFTGMFAPGLYFRLHSRTMSPSLLELGKDFLALRAGKDVPISSIARQMVNRFFGKKEPIASLARPTPLYLSVEHVQKAQTIIEHLKAQSNVPLEDCKVAVVAPDTASVVTRPPTALLATALADALRHCTNLIVCILPSYTEMKAAENLGSALETEFGRRVQLLPAQPRMTLLETTAFLDQADLFITGDTGVMHLAAATKRVGRSDASVSSPRNALHILALFGGTSPGLYAPVARTTIIGRGRKEQGAYRPGIAKESYNPRGQNLFDHISPQQVSSAIVSSIC